MRDRRGGHSSGEQPYDQLPVVSGRPAVGASSARTCDHCGARMSPRWPRTRVQGQLWCPACAQNSRSAALEEDEHHGPEVTYKDFRPDQTGISKPREERQPQRPKEVPRRPFLNIPGQWPYRTDLRPEEEIKSFDPFAPQPNGMPMHTNSSSRFVVRHGIGTLPLDAPPAQGFAYFLAADKPHIVRVAHDSGSTEVIYHCPFCGSGQVIARSDGTVECEFCQAAFTVQVQPEFSAFPQTINGQPVDIPGMGGTSDNPDVPEDGEDPDQAAAGPTTPPGGTEEQPPEEGEEDDDTDEPIDGGGNPIFNKKSSYHTGSGAVLDRQNYVRHLALGITTDRDRVLAHIRAERA